MSNFFAFSGDDSSENEVYLSDPSNPSSPWVDSFNAIGLVHRYVQSLPTDRFTDLAPYFEFESRVSGKSYYNKMTTS